jgi:chromosome segregation ATPase
MKLVDEIKKALAEATTGPWINHTGEFVSQAGSYMAICRVNETVINDYAKAKTVSGGRGSEQPNKTLIANAPEWLNSLIELVEQQQDEKVIQANRIMTLEDQHSNLLKTHESRISEMFAKDTLIESLQEEKVKWAIKERYLTGAASRYATKNEELEKQIESQKEEIADWERQYASLVESRRRLEKFVPADQIAVLDGDLP